MSSQPYNGPVAKLLMLNRPQGVDWLDYLSMGLTQADIPELIRLAQDHELHFMEAPENWPDDQDMPEWYSGIHAWRALGQLKAEEAIPVILGMLYQVDEEDNDWLEDDTPKIFALIGPVAIPALSAYLANMDNLTYARVAASSSLEEMAVAHPETRDECVAALLAVLQNHTQNDEVVNGFLISSLLEMGVGLENIALIEEIFESGNIDPSIDGDLEDVKIRLGLLEERTTPRRPPLWFGNDFSDDDLGTLGKASLPVTKQAAKKEKNKRKQEKKSRKKNRKKK